MGRERNGGGDNGNDDAGKPRVDSRIARRRQDPIGRRLRKIYTDVVEETVPDEFLAILEEAEVKLADPANVAGGVDPVDAAPRARSSQPER